MEQEEHELRVKTLVVEAGELKIQEENTRSHGTDCFKHGHDVNILYMHVIDLFWVGTFVPVVFNLSTWTIHLR